MYPPSSQYTSPSIDCSSESIFTATRSTSDSEGAAGGFNIDRGVVADEEMWGFGRSDEVILGVFYSF